ncbi:hypothetical protein BW730_14560 [Tessaracoccus aquimaris]|uniref:Methyltransferase type 11 domain-containing protein n=1 Tax=Tessaracoccus aquimaris TaxID=1332264 RepID=A0A1Q2CR08_9ACTN|nr:class I SAM-dependent methyltransferase [Tessaracoccus aquimaris]AQP48542.1 hypothetical protein BW730_14560 [Tessaracoccus aquimaris]
MSYDGYDVVAEAYANHFPGMEPEEPAELGALARFAAEVGAGGLVLDAGCGAGRVAGHLRSLGLRCVGVDLSPGMLAMARRDHPWLPTAVATITHLPIETGSVDGVMFWFSTIHIDDRDLDRALLEAARVLRPGGAVIAGFQTGDGPREVGEGYRELGLDVRMLRYHRRVAWMVDRFEQSGLWVIESVDAPPTKDGGDGIGVVLGRR